jgi:hypothetical protein
MTQRGRRGDSVAAAARQGDPYAATRLLGHYVEHDIEHTPSCLSSARARRAIHGGRALLVAGVACITITLI